MQRFIRRHEIINAQLELALASGDAAEVEKWERIRAIFDHLDYMDMSGDETEVEKRGVRPKIVRRRRTFWVHTEISKVRTPLLVNYILTKVFVQILHYVDSNYAENQLDGRVKPGPNLIERRLKSKSVDKSDPKPGLPRNMYSSDVEPEALKILAPVGDIPIPHVSDSIQVHSSSR